MNKFWRKFLGALLISPVVAVIIAVVIFVGKELIKSITCNWIDLLKGLGVAVGVIISYYILKIMFKYGLKLLSEKN